MTWIVAKQFLPGYVALFSDVQITWRSGEIRKDCLKKVYPLANNIVAGFSGSVDVGFLLLNDLNKYMANIDNTGKTIYPRKISERWHRRARKIFKKLPDEHKKLGCSIIMAGVSPTETNGNTDLPRSDIIVFRSNNDFKPKYIPFLKTASIGSGNNVDAYIEFMNGTNEMDNIMELSKADATLGGAGEHLAFMASIMLQDNQNAGISKHIHCTLVSKFGWQQFPLNFATYDKEDNKIETTMPKVAESYREFQQLQKSVLARGAAYA
jgi:hypothetical protein